MKAQWLFILKKEPYYIRLFNCTCTTSPFWSRKPSLWGCGLGLSFFSPLSVLVECVPWRGNAEGGKKKQRGLEGAQTATTTREGDLWRLLFTLLMQVEGIYMRSVARFLVLTHYVHTAKRELVFFFFLFSFSYCVRKEEKKKSDVLLFFFFFFEQ